MTNIKFITTIDTSYIPSEDITVIWRLTFIGPDLRQRSLIGWYHGEPDEKATAEYSNEPLTAHYDY